MRKRRLLSLQDTTDDGGLMNLTPLLDVLFVVLILFILIAPLLDLERVQLAPSGEKTMELTTLDSQRPIKIAIHQDDTLTISGHPISFERLAPTLNELHKIHPNEIPELFPDQRATFGTYQKVKNLIESAGFQELDIILKKE